MRPTALALALALALCCLAAAAPAEAKAFRSPRHGGRSGFKDRSEGAVDSNEEGGRARQGERCSQKADIFFALDSSHSVGRENFETVKKFLHGIVDQLLQRSTDFRFGFVVFSDKADMIVKLKDYSMSVEKERDALLEFILQEITYKSGKTVTGEAFQLIREQGFREENGHREEAQPVVVLLTDGQANGRVDPVLEAKALRNMGAFVVSLGIGSGVSRSRLERFASHKRFATFVRDFDDLDRVSQVITDTLCEAGGKPRSSEPCEPGLTLRAGKCVPEEPQCNKTCPEGYLLELPCKCVPDLEGNSSCSKSCKETEILAKGCVCVPRLSSLEEENAKEQCSLKCSEGKTLNKTLCRCLCANECPGSNFEQEADCRCVCRMQCRHGLALNKKSCTCDKVDCPMGMEYFGNKCRPKVRQFCEEGQVLINDICVRGKCPSGFEAKSDRKCYKVNCKIGYVRRKDGKCEKKCSGNKYYYKGKCQEPKECGNHQYFRVDSPGCQPTCNEPVLISKCLKEPEPQCICQPYFLLHEDKCIHPSDCPNIPICIQKADVVFMLDSSLTMTESNFYLMKNFVRDVVQQFYLRDGKRQRVGVLTFNHESNIVMDLNSFRDNSHEEILKMIENIQYEPGLTFLGEALHKVRTKMWNSLAGMRSDVPRVTILLTDGADTNGEVDQFFEADHLRESGSFFVTIAIGDGVAKEKKKFAKLAGPEGRVFMFGLREFQDLHSLVARVLSFHCEKPLCPHPYLVKGDCVGDYRSIDRVEYVPDDFSCRKVIKGNFSKERCACPKPKVSTGSCDNMFKNVTTTYYRLNRQKGVCESKSHDDRVRCGCPRGNRTESACKDQFRTITTVSYNLVKASDNSVTCKKKVENETRRCSCPEPERKYEECVNNFKIMHENVWQFDHTTRQCLKHSRTKEIRCSCPQPAVATGHCNGEFVPVKVYMQKVNARNRCDDVMWTASEKCERSCTNRIDVAFIVDSSDSVRGVNFEYIRRFIVAVSKKMDVSRDNTHVALIKYSSIENMEVVFNYISHYSLDSIANRVLQMRYSPGTTYTGEALYNFRRFLLNKINGYRGSEGGAESVVILITDGASNSDIDPLKEAAKIKALGCRIITVGVGEDIQAKQLDSIATGPADIHSFKTSVFSELTDPAFVSDVISATCRVGKVNKVSVKSRYANKIRDYMARGVDIDWSGWGFKKVDPKDLAQFTFKLRGSYDKLAGDSGKSRSRFLTFARNSIAKRLRIHPFAIRKLHFNRKSELTGLLKDSKIPKLRDLVSSKQLVVHLKDSDIAVDETSFQTMPHATLEVVRQASESADVVLSVVRPLRRLIESADAAVSHIKRPDARKLAGEDVEKMKNISSKVDDLIDKLITMSNEARRSRDQDVAERCLMSFKVLMTSTEIVAKHVGYIAYFSRKGDRDVLQRRIAQVTARVGGAFSEIGIAETSAVEAKKAKEAAAAANAKAAVNATAAPAAAGAANSTAASKAPPAASTSAAPAARSTAASTSAAPAARSTAASTSAAPAASSTAASTSAAPAASTTTAPAAASPSPTAAAASSPAPKK